MAVINSKNINNDDVTEVTDFIGINKRFKGLDSSLLGKGNQSDVDSLTASLAESMQDISARAVNAKTPFGTSLTPAKGDGIADDLSSIQTIINYVSSLGGGDVFIPSGIFKVGNTLVVLPKVRLVLSSGAIIEPMGDFHVVQLKPDGRITGGEINCGALSSFTHGFIYLNGADKFGGSGHNTSFIGMKLTSNNQQGDGIYFYATGNNNYIEWVHGYDIIFNGFNKAIHFQCVDAGSGAIQWINGNQFNKLGFNGNAYDIYLDGGKSTPNETSGNSFLDIQSEPSGNSQYFYISGNMNRIQGMLWDSGVISSTTKATLSANSQNTLVDTGLSKGYITDSGTTNQILSTGLPSYNIQVIPPAADANIPTFAGNQDDYLAYADKRFTVTQTGGPSPISGTNLSNAFNLSGDSSILYNAVTSGSPVVIEIDFPSTISYLNNIGLSFGPWKESPTYIKVEKNYAGNWSSLYDYTIATPRDYFVINNAPISFDKLRFTFYGSSATSNNIRINRIFAQNTGSYGQAFLPMVGGNLLGGLNMGGNYLTVGNVASLPTASATYRGQVILVLGNGTTTADTFYICLMSATGTYSWKQVMAG